MRASLAFLRTLPAERPLASHLDSARAALEMQITALSEPTPTLDGAESERIARLTLAEFEDQSLHGVNWIMEAGHICKDPDADLGEVCWACVREGHLEFAQAILALPGAWRPVETPPPLETEVLLFIRDPDGDQHCQAVGKRFGDNHWYWNGWGRGLPSRWQPLPAPPNPWGWGGMTDAELLDEARHALGFWTMMGNDKAPGHAMMVRLTDALALANRRLKAVEGVVAELEVEGAATRKLGAGRSSRIDGQADGLLDAASRIRAALGAM